MTTKSGLAIILSKLSVFSKPKLKLEQYPTDSEIAAEILWNAYLMGDIEGRRIADFGCGTGILTIGAAILGGKAEGFEVDINALDIARENALKVSVDAAFIHADVKDVSDRFDTIIENPPFGTREKGKDSEFLEKAFGCADVIYTLHKESTLRYIEGLAQKSAFMVSHRWDYDFPLKNTLPQHKKRIERIRVSCLRLVKVRAPA